jgi:HD-GYP domain-containing protein (c-di-GMP phosphodiesterase class II)
MKQRIDTRYLEIGIFVAELDRPWLESPFLFQGFLIEGEEDLATLRELCEWVMYDPERSLESVRGKRVAAGGASVRDEHENAMSREMREKENDPRQFAETFKRVIHLHRQAEIRFTQVIDDRRLKKRIDYGPLKEIVSELATVIEKHPNAALWLTKLHAQDELTATHCVNVAIFSMAFAHYRALPREMVREIGLGALLHDVGLTGPANCIIRQKERLSTADFLIVKRHPIEAFASLDRVHLLPEITRKIIRWHHERLDGSGYPDRLSSDEIPEYVRMVGIADAYDAMASDRAYRPGKQPTEALTELHTDAEHTFGTQLVEEFIRCIGIYPVGAVVKLNTGAIGLVASSLPGARLTPLVLLIKDAEGRSLYPRRMVNLEVVANRYGRRWSIDQVVDPAEYRINIANIAMDEMRAFR